MTHRGEAFNLVDEPWITALDRDGHVVQLSLTEVFERAEHIDQLVGEVPTQYFAILRLLLAILHRASGGPRDRRAWETLLRDWPRAVGLATGYLETFRNRFDLRHETEPFFQVADLRTAKGEVSDLEKLIADVPNGLPYLTTRLGRGLERISWAEAARWLVHVHAFDPSGIRSGAVGDPRVKGGKGYPIGTGWAGQIGGIAVVGETLATTLMLNLVVPSEVDVESPATDLPPWERPQLDQCVDDSHGGEPRGLVDLYTWQARRVRLVGDDEGVTGLVLAQGDRMTPQNRHNLEAMTAWRFSEPQTKKHRTTVYMPQEHRAERIFWRGLEGLVAHTTGGDPSSGGPARTLQPAVVTWAARLSEEGLVSGVVRLRATGVEYGSNSSTFEEIIDDELLLPVDVLADDGLAHCAIDAVRAAEAGANAVARLARDIARASGGSTEDDGPASRARERAYAELDAPFRGWLAGLTAEKDRRAALTEWHRAARELFYRESRDLVRQAGPAAWVGRAVQGRHLDLGRADALFLDALGKALPLASRRTEGSEGNHE